MTVYTIPPVKYDMKSPHLKFDHKVGSKHNVCMVVTIWPGEKYTADLSITIWCEILQIPYRSQHSGGNWLHEYIFMRRLPLAAVLNKQGCVPWYYDVVSSYESTSILLLDKIMMYTTQIDLTSCVLHWDIFSNHFVVLFSVDVFIILLIRNDTHEGKL